MHMSRANTFEEKGRPRARAETKGNKRKHPERTRRPYQHGMQQDPWGNAVACALAALAASDPWRRAILIDLGEFWLELARHHTSQINAKLAIEIAMIEKMQSEILGVRTTTH